MSLGNAPIVGGLTGDEQITFAKLWTTLQKKAKRNALKSNYYYAKNKVKDLGIAIPPQLKDVETVVGWPAKAVDTLAARSRFDGFVFTDGDGVSESARGLEYVLEENRFDLSYRGAVTSELTHSCAFITVSRGARNEPTAIVSTYSALNATATWNQRLKRIDAGLVVIERGEVSTGHEPVRLNLLMSYAVFEIAKTSTGWRTTSVKQNFMGRALIEPMAYRASSERPFGYSRITRPVIALTDSAVRTALRTEVAAEFFTAPQRYLLGADESALKDVAAFEAYLGVILDIGLNEEGERPEYGQLPAASMQPHVDYMRSLASRFAGETAIPVSSLGIVHDNPSSADAIYAAKEELIIEAQSLNDSNGHALKSVAQMVLAIINNRRINELSDAQRSVTARFGRPDRPSIVSQSDAMIKQVSAAPWLAETRVFLEELGYDEAQIARLMAEKRRASALTLIDSINRRSESEE